MQFRDRPTAILLREPNSPLLCILATPALALSLVLFQETKFIHLIGELLDLRNLSLVRPGATGAKRKELGAFRAARSTTGRQTASIELLCTSEEPGKVTLQSHQTPGIHYGVIPEKDPQRGFEEFSTRSSQREIQGAGLGLAIIKRLGLPLKGEALVSSEVRRKPILS
jgi:hypothetical protein